MKGVSAVMPVYKPDERWLEEAVDSVLSQSYEKLELVIVDDGSNVSVSETLSDEYVDNEKVRIIRQENSGFTAASNKGFKEAKFDLLAPIGDDDSWAQDKIEKQVERIEDGFDIVFSQGYYMDEESNRFHECTQIAPKKVENLIIHKFPIYESALIRRSVFEEHGYLDENFDIAADKEFWLRVWPDISFDFVEELLVSKRMHIDNIGGRTEETLAEDLRIRDIYSEKYNIPNKNRKKSYSRLYRKKGIELWEDENKSTKARNLWLKAIKERPFDYKSYVLLVSSVSESSYELSKKIYSFVS